MDSGLYAWLFLKLRNTDLGCKCFYSCSESFVYVAEMPMSTTLDNNRYLRVPPWPYESPLEPHPPFGQDDLELERRDWCCGREKRLGVRLGRLLQWTDARVRGNDVELAMLQWTSMMLR